MAVNLHSLHLMILALLLAAFYLDLSAAVFGGSRVGGYEPIKDLSDPEVQSIAKFAVDQHNKEAKTDLMYQKVVKGDSQVVAGENFKLVIVAKDGGGVSHQYEAIVWVKSWINFKNLTSFTELKQNVFGDSRLGGYEPIKDLSDPEVQSIAKFAVDQHNKEANTDLKYQKVVKGDSQVVAGENFKLVIVAKDGGGVSHRYEAIVWVKPWINFKKLTSFTQLK